ncbi:helix-turn-helix domain-containing protein [Rhizobium leguminosarum]|uniref:helix-turn-helix domain-containing protein n=1 Tax=Rhizobium leguminosarum TaxID=384 RepID=UPI001FEEB4EF|nr:helix-turn-helix domain-containing protein [Rhizobium leguminosarum]
MVSFSNITPAASMAIPAEPLIVAVSGYLDALTAYNSLEEEDFPLDGREHPLATPVHDFDAILTNWKNPATSAAAALAAISLAERERAVHNGESPVADAMYAATRGYLENLARPPSEPVAPAEGTPRVSLKDLTPDVMLLASEAAAYLRVSEVTLARWRSGKRGPIYVKTGGRVLYRVSSLLDYVAKGERQGTRPQN